MPFLSFFDIYLYFSTIFPFHYYFHYLYCLFPVTPVVAACRIFAEERRLRLSYAFSPEIFRQSATPRDAVLPAPPPCRL